MELKSSICLSGFADKGLQALRIISQGSKGRSRSYPQSRVDLKYPQPLFFHQFIIQGMMKISYSTLQFTHIKICTVASKTFQMETRNYLSFPQPQVCSSLAWRHELCGCHWKSMSADGLSPDCCPPAEESRGVMMFPDKQTHKQQMS